MRTLIATACGVFVAAACYSGAAIAQITSSDLAALKMVQPEAERPGDRLLSCAQISQEMSTIMEKRNLQQVVHASKDKICRGKKVLDRQSDEKQKLALAQAPALMAASVAPGPMTNVIVTRTSAETVALETRQQPARRQATTEMMSGVGGMVGLFNDPRLMRLGLLAQEHQCAESAPRPPPKAAAEACDNTDEARPTASIPRPPGKESSGPADPFAVRGKSKPAAVAVGENDAAAKSDPFALR